MEMMKMKMNLARTALPAMALALAACTGRGSRNAAAATAAVHDASGRLLGHLTATESPAGLVLTGEATGLPPEHTASTCMPSAAATPPDSPRPAPTGTPPHVSTAP